MAEEITRAKLIPVSGKNNTPDMNKAVEVQINPTSLKVALSNTLKTGKKGKSKKAAQYVDKSSSNLTVELIFDTSRDDTDVRLKTKKIAAEFMDTTPKKGSKKLSTPSRCKFQWGAFAFVGMIQSFDETLDFFSSEGTPLRSTVSLKLTEDNFQFLTNKANQTAKQTPTLTSTGNQKKPNKNSDKDGGAGKKHVVDANKEADKPEKEWRDTALYNGEESPRFPSGSALSVPNQSVAESISLSTGTSASVAASAGSTGFKFGASASLGTRIEGAFSGQVKENINKGLVTIRPGTETSLKLDGYGSRIRIGKDI